MRQSVVIGGAAVLLSALSLLPAAGARELLSVLHLGLPVLLLLLLLVALRFSELRTLLCASSLLAFALVCQFSSPSLHALHWMLALLTVDFAFIAVMHEPVVDWEIAAWWSGWPWW